MALPALVHGPLHGNASGFGLILAAWGAGALGGAIGAGALGKRQHKGLIMLLAGLLMAAMIALLPTRCTTPPGSTGESPPPMKGTTPWSAMCQRCSS